MTDSVECNICAHAMDYLFEQSVLSRLRVKYYRCVNCGFVQTESPYWLEEAYQTPITLQDTGLLGRNIGLSRIASLIALRSFGPSLRWLDYAGGYGIMTRLARDYGFDCQWYDKYTQNLFARGFEAHPDEGWDFMTAFEYLEHIPDPLGTLRADIRPYTRALLFSTEIIPSPVPPAGAWDYYGPQHGQHISFYTLESLRLLARRLSWELNSDGRFIHFFSERALDAFTFRLITRFARLLFPIVRRFIQSRTIEDSRHNAGQLP